jgi:heat shock protein HtpX
MSIYQQIADNNRKSLFLIVFFILIVAGLGYLFGVALEYGYSLFIGATVFAIFSAGFSYFYSDRIALSMTGAKEVQSRDEPRLFHTVENLSIGAGITPMPKVYIIEDRAINAFATGRDPKHSAIAVTRGALDKLEDIELEGVIAHELSHIKNFDIRTMAIAVVLVGIIALVSEWFLRAQWFGGRRDRNREGGGGLIAIFAIVGALLAPLIGQLLKLALSRQREYLADASGALLTRYPEGLARALEKIATDQNELKGASTANAHLFIENPLKRENLVSLFSTHPPVEERIRRLREM